MHIMASDRPSDPYNNRSDGSQRRSRGGSGEARRAATGPAGGPKDLSSLGLDQDPDQAADAPNAIEGKCDRR
jgi:hypothetical protein